MKRFCFLVSVVVLLSSQHIFADHSHPTPDKLGTVSFPTSCSVTVQDSFVRGIALLHSFAYEDAGKQFQEIEKADPGCAIAYWGEAMSLYHELWGRPGQLDLKHGWELLQKATAVGARTQRERDYINALAVFYRDYDTTEYEERAAAYPAAMEKLYQQYPQDREAAAFYALSLLSWEDGTTDYLANTKKAIAILTDLFEKEPDHPGAAHYLIHACDTPQFAAQGLAAARRYAKIAPSSPHALHMPSHIFARLGLWQDDIQSNLASEAAARQQSSVDYSLHAMEFLEYAYLQIGEETKAQALINELQLIPKNEISGNFADSYNRRLAAFPALYTLELRHWNDALKLHPVEGATPDIQGITYWARAIAAGHLRNVEAARAALEELDAAIDATSKSKQPLRAGPMHRLHIEAAAWLSFAEGKGEEAVAQLRPTADRQDKIGKGEVELPAREMIAEILLETNHPAEALAEYEKSLKSDPSRLNAIYGAARSAEAAHVVDKTNHYYAQLRAIANGASSDRPELVRAKLRAQNSLD